MLVNSLGLSDPAGLITAPDIPDDFQYPVFTGAIWVDDCELYQYRRSLIEAATAHVCSCSPWQIRKALNAQGLRSAVENAVAASTDQELKDGWEFATEFRSDDPFVISMGTALGKTAEETAALIQYASTL